MYIVSAIARDSREVVDIVAAPSVMSLRILSQQLWGWDPEQESGASYGHSDLGILSRSDIGAA